MRSSLALAAAACAGLMAAAPAAAIVGGSPTTAFAAVGAGVQISPDWVLTVHHLGFNVGSAYSNGYGQRSVAAVYAAPGSGVFPAHDLMLLRLSPDAGAAPAPWLPVSADLFAAGTFPAQAVTITSWLNHGPDRGYGFSTVTQFVTELDPDDGGPLGPVTVNYLLSDDSVVHVQGGDSGGGLFLGHVTEATSPLLGLGSAQLQDAAGQPVGSGFLLLAAYRDWIDQTLAADPVDTQSVNWVSAVPEPGTWALWALGLAALGGTVARRSGARTV